MLTEVPEDLQLGKDDKSFSVEKILCDVITGLKNIERIKGDDFKLILMKLIGLIMCFAF